MDITGFSPRWWKEYKKLLTSGYKSIFDSVSDEFVIDISFAVPIIPGVSLKVGVSIVVNLDDDYIEFYPHIGGSFGFSMGPSIAFGVLENYKNPGDYKEWFEYGEGGYFVVGGHCYGADNNLTYSDSVKAYYIEISTPNVSGGKDYYYYNKKLIIDWGVK